MTDDFVKSSGNIFEDIGDSDPKSTLTRTQIISRIVDIINDKGLSEIEAAKVLGISPTKVSLLMNGKLSQFSLDELFLLLNALDKDIEIIIKPKADQTKGKVRVLIE